MPSLSTATGLDCFPAWFLRLVTPVFFQPIAYLFNLSLATSAIPKQWKQASIIPIPKSLPPKQHADFRPISNTPVLARIMEKTVYLANSFIHSLIACFNSTFLRPICIPFYRLTMCGNYLPAQHHHKHAPLQSISYSNFLRLQQSF